MRPLPWWAWSPLHPLLLWVHTQLNPPKGDVVRIVLWTHCLLCISLLSRSTTCESRGLIEGVAAAAFGNVHNLIA
ncbi:hypothetical protein M758_1G305700 [Ceratodon purpureus]|nr:hypothetical protein M758_1G305700 [Ceratodon purpureus]